MLDEVQGERELIIEESMLAGQRSADASARLLADELIRLAESTRPVLDADDSLSVSTRHELGQLTSDLRERVAAMRSDPLAVDFQGWALLADQASRLAIDVSDVPERLGLALERLAGRIEQSLAADRERFEADVVDAEADATERVSAAVAACGEFALPPAPPPEELVSWLVAHPEALADLLEG